MAEEIDPRRLYSFAEAAALVPSPHAGRTISVFTLRRWRRSGALKAQVRKVGGRVFYFAYGADLMTAMGAEAPPRFCGRTAAQRERAANAAIDRMRRRGAYKPKEGNSDAQSP